MNSVEAKLDSPIVEERLNSLIDYYNGLVLGIEGRAASDPFRAYGGIIRAGKGELVERLAESLVRIAWTDVLSQKPERIKADKAKRNIYIKDGYIERIADPRVREYVKAHQNELVYKFGTDVQVSVDDRLALPIECKAFTENAMLKRILFDAKLMKEAAGTDVYYLVQLESQLGGDYGDLDKEVALGSPATHVLLSQVDVELKIITLLEGERKVDRPIHKMEYFKELRMEPLKKAVRLFANDLEKYI